MIYQFYWVYISSKELISDICMCMLIVHIIQKMGESKCPSVDE